MEVAIRANTSEELAKLNRQMAVDFMGDVRKSLIYKYNWSELLSAAPVSLSLMGSCYVASSSTATAISLTEGLPPGHKFIKLRYDYLRPCLVQVSDTGTKVFILAEKNMALISETCGPMNRTVNKIIEDIAHLPDTSEDLVSKLDFLKESSDNCLQWAKDVEKAFDGWLDLVSELHQVTISRNDKTVDMAEENARMLAEQKARLEGTLQAEKTAKEAAETMKESMKKREEEYKKAADQIPGPWESLGFTVVEGLSKTVTTGLSQMMNKMTDPINYIKDQLSGGDKGGQRGGNRNLPDAPQEPKDPAYAAAEMVNIYLTKLHSLLSSGEKSGINWTALKENGGQGLSSLQGSLGIQLENTKFTTALPSTTLKQCINDGLKIIQEITTAIANEKKVGSEPASEETIRGWQNKALEIKTQVLSLKVTSISLPGNTPITPGVLGTPPSDQSKETGGSSILAAAAENLKVTQKTYLDTQKNYMEANKEFVKVQQTLGKIRGQLAKLGLQGATLKEVMSILNECISLLGTLKGEIQKLVRFFSAISNMVEIVIKSHVNDFRREIEVAKKKILGGVSLMEYQKKNIYTSCLMVRCYFSLVGDVSDVYVDVSKTYITKGIDMCIELSKCTKNNMSDQERSAALVAKNAELNEYTDTIEQEVKTRVEKKQKEIMGQLDKRVERIAGETKYLPELLPEQKKAIEAPLEKAIEAGNQKVIEYRSEEEKSTLSLKKYTETSNFAGGFSDDE